MAGRLQVDGRHANRERPVAAFNPENAYDPGVLSLLALVCWIGGLLLLTLSPWLGACLAAAGFVFAGKAVFRKDDMGMLFGLMFLFVIAVNAVVFIRWLLR